MARWVAGPGKGLLLINQQFGQRSNLCSWRTPNAIFQSNSTSSNLHGLRTCDDDIIETFQPQGGTDGHELRLWPNCWLINIGPSLTVAELHCTERTHEDSCMIATNWHRRFSKLVPLSVLLFFVMWFVCLGQLTLRSIPPAVHEGVRQCDVFNALSWVHLNL